MTLYRCNNCDAEFIEDEAGRYVPYDAIDAEFENQPICPYCDSFDIVEVWEDEPSEESDQQ